MQNIIVIAEIEQTLNLSNGKLPTPYRSHVWKYVLWITYAKYLPFMANTDTEYDTTAYQFSNLIIDSKPYYRALTIAECETVEGSWYLDGVNLHIHYVDHSPPITIWSALYGMLYGYTNKGVRRYNQNTYLPEVDSVPSVSESVDPVQYSRMAFQSGSATLKNFLKTFDNQAAIFGNDFNVKAGLDTGNYSDLVPIQKSYIENYTVSTSKATFALKDKRELLSIKCPSDLFNLTDFPYIKDQNIDKVIPDAFGACYGVPGICVNSNAGNVARVFKFASTITTVSKVWSKKNDQWNDITPFTTSSVDGTISIPVAYACSGGTAINTGVYTNGEVEIKCDGIFRPETNPGDVIAKINTVYGNIQFTETNYKLEEWESELRPLADIGLYMGSSKDIYSWIEEIQNGSTVGFRYYTEYDKITARLDNPNRDVLLSIQAEEMTNINEIEIDYNATLYASSAKIGYAKDYKDGESNYFVNKDFELDVIALHRKPFEYETDSLLLNVTDASDKSDIIMDDQKDIRPIFRGVKVFGAKWLGALRIYDIVNANITIQGIRVPYIAPFEVSIIYLGSGEITEIQIGAEDILEIVNDYGDTEILQYIGPDKETADDYDLVEHESTDIEELAFIGIRRTDILRNTSRTFVGNVRCQVIGKSIDPATCEVSYDLRQRDYSEVFAEVIGG